MVSWSKGQSPIHFLIHLALTKNMIHPPANHHKGSPRISALDRWYSGVRGSVDRRKHLVSMRRDWMRSRFRGPRFKILHWFLFNDINISIVSLSMRRQSVSFTLNCRLKVSNVGIETFGWPCQQPDVHHCCGLVTFVLGMESTALLPRRLSFNHSTKFWLNGGSMRLTLPTFTFGYQKRDLSRPSPEYPPLFLKLSSCHSLSGRGSTVLWSSIRKFLKGLRSRGSARLQISSMSWQSEQLAIVLFKRNFLWPSIHESSLYWCNYIHCKFFEQ